MKTRSERYKNESTIKRTDKNQNLYDELYFKTEVSNTVTLMDNVNEIDIRKIKDIMNSREEYQKINQYKDLMKIKEEDKVIEKQIEEIDYNKYDINELIELKKQNKSVDEDIIRKLSNTQYDILKKLNINKNEDFYSQEEKLKTLINEIKKTDINNEKSMIDLFSDIKEEVNQTEYRTKDNSFYSSKLEFKDKDFETSKKKKENLTTKILLTVMILLMIAIGVIVFINFI